MPIELTSNIIPKNNGTFPTHDALYGRGGRREVDSIQDRDGVPSSRRTSGMQVYVRADSKTYVLQPNLVSWVEDPLSTRLAAAESTLSGLSSASFGLGNVDNTSDVTKNAAVATLTNKTIDLLNNTLTGTVAQFNSALVGDDFALQSNLSSYLLATTKGAASGLTPLGADIKVPLEFLDLTAIQGSLSLRQFMSPEQWADANSATPALDHSGAFLAAFNAASTLYPGAPAVFVNPVAGYYRVKDIDVPGNMTLFGHARKVYNPLSAADVLGRGSVITMVPDGTNMFRWRSGTTVQSLMFYGPGKTSSIDCFQTVSGRFTQMRILNCGIYAFRYGYGNSQYVSSTRMIGCNLAQNAKAIYGPVDSVFIGNFINANSNQGIDLPSGANDNSFIGNKVEFNDLDGIRCFEALDNVFSGNIVDRNGLSGLSAVNSSLSVSGGFWRRNGRFNLGQAKCAHIYTEGSTTQISVTGIVTAVGGDDGGGGDTTPNYGVSFAGTATGKVVVTGNDFSGAVTSGALYTTIPTSLSMTGNINAEDRVNTGFSKIDSVGTRYMTRGTTGTLATTASIVISYTQPAISTNARRVHRLKMTSRNVTTGATYSGELIYNVIRESGSASIVIVTTLFENGANIFGPDVADVVQVVIGNVATDGSTFDITVTNHAANSITATIDWAV